MVAKQVIILLVLSVVCALALNSISPNRIALVGSYRNLSDGDGPIVPPSAAAGDPSFIDVNVAQMEFSMGRVLFVDAREPEEFNCGTIPGAINIPFESLPDDLDSYLDSVLAGFGKDAPMILFCSGEECDLSLHLGRNLQDLGYTGVSIFFGGAREWERFGLDVERREMCE